MNMKTNRKPKEIAAKARTAGLLTAAVLLFCLFALLITGCGEETGGDKDSGTGTVNVTLTVKGEDGEEKSYPVTAKEGDTLLSAMEQAGILEKSGIRDGMVYTISGETADYNEDKSYWAFYQDGEYMVTGAGETVLEDGATYSFVRTFEEGTGK